MDLWTWRLVDPRVQWRNYGPAGPAAAGGPGKKGPKRGPFSSHIGRDGNWGPIFAILRASVGGPKFEVTPLPGLCEPGVQWIPGVGDPGDLWVYGIQRLGGSGVRWIRVPSVYEGNTAVISVHRYRCK